MTHDHVQHEASLAEAAHSDEPAGAPDNPPNHADSDAGWFRHVTDEDFAKILRSLVRNPDL